MEYDSSTGRLIDLDTLDYDRMVKWVKEIVLHRYWVERCSEDGYNLDGRKVLSARLNPITDRFPDIVGNRIEGLEVEVPAEVEWTTDDFRRHEHSVDFLKDRHGFLIVWKETSDFPLTQVPIRRARFESWLGKNYGQMLNDTIAEIDRRVEEDRNPRMWVIYVSHSVEKNLELGFSRGTWGFPGKSGVRHQMYAQAVKKGDVVVFIGPWEWGPSSTKPTGGRVDARVFRRGQLKRISAHSVTESYFEDTSVLWPLRDGEVWKHRIGIERKPLFEAQDVPSSPNSLGGSLPDLIRKAMVGASDRPVEITPALIPSLFRAIGHSYR